MNKSDLVQKLAQKLGKEKVEVERFLEAVGEVMQEAFVANDSIKFNDVCIIETVSRAARTGRNPQNGESVSIPASRSLRIKTLTATKRLLNA